VPTQDAADPALEAAPAVAGPDAERVELVGV